MNLELFRNKYNFDKEINHHMHQGYNIYTTGRYDTYEEAVAARDIIIDRYGIGDAFVVKFVSGERLHRLRDEK
jgi:hypothetical protein